MVPYRKGCHDFVLIANTSFGVIKLAADDLGSYKPIDSPTKVNVAGAPFDTITTLEDVQHLAQLSDASAVILTATRGAGPRWSPGPSTGPMSLQTISLP